MCSLMNTLMFASAPFPRPETIVGLNGQTPQAEFLNLSMAEIDEIRAHPANPFANLAAHSGTLETVTVPGQLPEQVQGTAAQAELFKVLKTPPLLGRTFTDAECVAGHDTVVLLTERFWREKFGARPDAIGQTLRISGRVFTIIGVLPEAYSSMFIFGEPRYFRPLVPSEQQVTDRNRREFAVIGRLAHDTSMLQALAQLAPLTDRWAKDHPTSYPTGYHLRMQLAGRVGGSANVAIITLLLGLAAAILALACANLANLQMARAVARIRDLAIRTALGATRWTLIRQQLMESMLLSIAGGGLGLLVAHWSSDLIGRNIRLGLSSTLQMPVDGRVLAFTAVISILAGLGFGLALAGIGLYGIVANNVCQRMTEFGSRLALGASGTDVLKIVLLQSLVLTVVGLGLGALGSFGLGLALRQALGSIIAQNQLILAGTSVAIFLVALGATWLPARRATTADPIVDLRAE